MSSSKSSNTFRPNTDPVSTSTSTTSTRTTNSNTPFTSSPARRTSTRTTNTSYTSTSTFQSNTLSKPNPKYPNETWSAWKAYRGESDKPDDEFIEYKKVAIGELEMPRKVAGSKKEGPGLIKSSSDPTGLGFKTAVSVERARRKQTEDSRA